MIRIDGGKESCEDQQQLAYYSSDQHCRNKSQQPKVFNDLIMDESFLLPLDSSAAMGSFNPLLIMEDGLYRPLEIDDEAPLSQGLRRWPIISNLLRGMRW